VGVRENGVIYFNNISIEEIIGEPRMVGVADFILINTTRYSSSPLYVAKDLLRGKEVVKKIYQYYRDK
jgi:hypothetical protein